MGSLDKHVRIQEIEGREFRQDDPHGTFAGAGHSNKDDIGKFVVHDSIIFTQIRHRSNIKADFRGLASAHRRTAAESEVFSQPFKGVS